jgi:transposase-like protein
MGCTGVSKSRVSGLCAEIDDNVKAFLVRLDATYVKVRSSTRTPFSWTRPRTTRSPGRAFPPHWLKIRSTNALERVNGEVKRRHLSNDDTLVRLVGTILLEQNDEWAVQRARYMTLEAMATLSDDAFVGLPAMVI